MAWPTPDGDRSVRASSAIHSPTGSRCRWIVRSVLTNRCVRKSSARERPLPKSANATARWTGVGSSPATSGIAKPEPARGRAPAPVALGERAARSRSGGSRRPRRRRATARARSRRAERSAVRSSGRERLLRQRDLTPPQQRRARAQDDVAAPHPPATASASASRRPARVNRARGLTAAIGTAPGNSTARRTTCIGAGVSNASIARASNAVGPPPCMSVSRPRPAGVDRRHQEVAVAGEDGLRRHSGAPSTTCSGIDWELPSTDCSSW